MTHYPRKVSSETAGQAKRRAIIAAMRQGTEYTSGDLERMTGIPSGSVSYQMKKLRDMGLVERTGRVGKIQIYRLAEVKVTA